MIRAMMIRATMMRARVSARAGLAVMLATFTVLTVSGCSSVPDAANPAEWYRGTKRWVVGKDAADESAAESKDSKAEDKVQTAKNGDGESFPNLGKGPDRAPVVTAASKREQEIKGLIADRQRARYTDDPVAEPPPEVTLGRAGQPRTPALPAGAVLKGETLPPPGAATPSPAPQPPSVQPQVAAAQPQTPTTPPRAPLAAASSRPAPTSTPTGPYNDFETVVVSGDSVQKGKGFVPPPAKMASNTFAATSSPPAYGGASESYLIAVIPFGPTSTALVREDRLLLGDVVAAQREYGGLIRVVGYAGQGRSGGQVGSRLSSDRADKVAHELLNQGAPQDSVSIDDVGESGPPPEGATANRAEVYFDY